MSESGDVERAAAAIRAGELVVLPTDTVYGIAAGATSPEATARLYAVKGRRPDQPTAIVSASVDDLLRLVPGLSGDVVCILRALLPGPLTLVVPNVEHRLPWLTGERPDTLGVRVPDVTGPARALLDLVGAVAATSANLPGGPDPRSVEEVPRALRAQAAVTLDGGVLPGLASTVVDLTGEEPHVLREGAVPAGVILSRITGLRDCE